MKTITSSLLCLLVAGGFSGTAMAKDLYISAQGSDSNSGLEASKARATLTSLNDIIEEGDVIHVSGIIDLSKEIALGDGIQDKNATWGHYISYNGGKQNGFFLNGSNTTINGKLTPWKEITFIGENPDEDGFDGNGAMRLFYVRGDNNKTTATFKNLSLKNGIAPGEGGGAFFIHDNGRVVIENCILENHHLDLDVLKEETHSSGNVVLKNPQSERGGAILFQTGRLTIKDSQFINNLNRRGGAICQNGGVLTVTNTRFEGNGADVDGKYVDNSRGGAIHLWPLNEMITASFDHCDFINNTTWNSAGALYLQNNTDGGNLLDALFTNCSFVQNQTIDGQGGAVVINNAENYGSKDDKCKNIIVTFANTSFLLNGSKSEAGAVFMNGGIKNDVTRFVNCTFAKNTTQGNAGHGAGYVESEANSTYKPGDTDRYFYNCLFEQNECPTASGGAGEYSDLLTYDFLEADHTYVGRAVFTKTTEDNFLESLAALGVDVENNFWHGKLDGKLDGSVEFDLQLSFESLSGFDWSAGRFVFATLEEGSDYLTKGDTKYLTLAPSTISAPNGKEFALQGYDISAADQMGFPRGEGTCAVGAMEASTQTLDEYYDGREFPFEAEASSGVEAVADSIHNNIAIVADTVVAEGEQITVYSISGALVASGKDSVNIGNLVSGVYVVKAGKASIKVVK